MASFRQEQAALNRKVGRPAIGTEAMSAAERMRRYRARLKATEI
jgi:hypothetical protein